MQHPDRIARRMARRAHRTSAQGEGIHPPARPAECRTARPAVGEVEKNYVFDGPDGKQTLADLFDGRSQLVVKHFMFGPGLDGRLRRLLVRGGPCRRRAGASASITTCAMSRYRARRSTRSRRSDTAWAGRSTGCRPTATTSTTTSTCRSRRSRSPAAQAFYNYATRPSRYRRNVRPQRVLQGRGRRDLPHLLVVRARRRDVPRQLRLPGHHAEGPQRNHQRQSHRLGSPPRPI